MPGGRGTIIHNNPPNLGRGSSHTGSASCCAPAMPRSTHHTRIAHEPVERRPHTRPSAAPPARSAAAHSYPRLVGDIGGTHARFARLLAPEQPLQDLATYRCADFPSL